MAVQIISSDQAFSEGAELWVIPDRKSSYWARRIDWHLQFLISRSMIHQSSKISPTLEKIVRENEVDIFVEELPKNSPLLIFSVDLLPNREIIHLPFGNNFPSWVERAQQVWKDLKKPSARIFLPSERDASEFSENWTDKKGNLSVVIDTGGH